MIILIGSLFHLFRASERSHALLRSFVDCDELILKFLNLIRILSNQGIFRVFVNLWLVLDTLSPVSIPQS